MALIGSLKNVIEKLTEIFSIIFKEYTVKILLDSSGVQSVDALFDSSEGKVDNILDNIVIVVGILSTTKKYSDCYNIYKNFLSASGGGNTGHILYVRFNLLRNQKSIEYLEELYNKNDGSLELYLEMQ